MKGGEGQVSCSVMSDRSRVALKRQSGWQHNMRNMSEKSIFTRIIDREIPGEIVYENEQVIAFRDIAPQAPVHVLVVPKVPFRDLLEADATTIMALMEGCKEVAAVLGLVEAGFRLIINTGKGGGQTVFHLHAHILGGTQLEWGV